MDTDQPQGTPLDAQSGTSGDDLCERHYLDREHQARVSKVANCDIADDRRAAAEVELGRLTEEEQELNEQRKSLGGDEYIEGITQSRWLPYQPALEKGAWTLWLCDGLLWGALCAGIIARLVESYNG
jgi:hypothetical protein